ncbi:MAG: hypothetical protein ABR969_06400 [Sedimentisphaerales bacterium]|jgi:hypothetical protein
MQESKVVIVHLRRPDQSNEKEMRSDPFYEFGSFGCTGCHDKNLMNPKRIKELDGVRLRLAFAQGGPDGFKLIQLTPPVKFEKYELKWDKKAKFFKYEKAPLLINNAGCSNFPFFKKMIKKMLRNGKRTTLSGQFSSCFRSRREQLPNSVALDIIKKYSAFVKSSPKEYFANDYTETMHRPPPKPDKSRKETYQNFIRKAKTAKTCKCRCKKKSC